MEKKRGICQKGSMIWGKNNIGLVASQFKVFKIRRFYHAKMREKSY